MLASDKGVQRSVRSLPKIYSVNDFDIKMTHKEGQGKLEFSSPCNGIYGGQSKMFNAVTCVLGNFAYNLLETAREKVTEREVNP